MAEAAAISWYRKGKVTVTWGSTKVIGIDTNWLTAGIHPGATFRLNDYVSPAREVARVISDTELELVEPCCTMHSKWPCSYHTVSGADYSIDRHNQLPLPADLLAKLASLVGYDLNNTDADNE